MPGIADWIIREERTLWEWLLKHVILIEVAMIKLQFVIGYLILRSRTIPLEWLIVGGVLLTAAVSMALRKIKHGRWL